MAATSMVNVQESPETLLAILQALYSNGATVAELSNSKRDMLEFPEQLTKKSNRTMALLDAVASLSVQNARHQAIAVSITLKANDCVLHIAGNDGVNEVTLSHLNHVLMQLKFIRSSLTEPLKPGTEKLDTPTPQKSGETRRLEDDLLQSVYAFSWRKFRQRVMKRQARFETEVIPCMKKFADEKRDSWTSEEVSDYQKFEETVVTLVACFEWAKLKCQDEKVVPIIKKLGDWVTVSALQMRRMLEDEGTTSRITSWEIEIMERSDSEAFPLRRYLSKVFSLSYHFQSLLTNIAYSYRMGHILDTLIIERINCVSESNTFTLSKDIVQQIVMGFGFTDNDAVEEVTSSIINFLPPSFTGTKPLTRSITNNIHCEALLLRYHFLNPTFPPFSYIGVSKLSCYPCCALFHAFNKSVGQGHKYFTKGCNNKLYSNWILPRFSSLDSSIRKCLVKEHFGVALKEWLRTQSESRCSSDSTDVSTTLRRTESRERKYTRVEIYQDLGLNPPI